MSIAQHGMAALAISCVFTALAFCILLLRLYTRLFIIRYFRFDEYLIILAMLCSIALTAAIGVQVRYGMGKHISDIDPADTSSSLKAFWISLIVYNLSLGVIKSSILLQYLNVFPPRKFRIACWVILAIVVGYTIWTVCASIFFCIPVDSFWTGRQPARCLNRYAMWFTNASINIVSDFVIILLPMPIIRSLNLARAQKRALIGVFAVGGFVCLVSIFRLQSLVKISTSHDETYDNPPAATWSSVETNIGIICSCLPCLRPLMTRVFPSIMSSGQRQSSGVGGVYHPRNEPATMLRSIGSEAEAGGSEWNKDSKEGKGNIRVLTEVHVRVEESDVLEREDGVRKGNMSTRSENSTETLVRGIGNGT
ncbi:hypothetical protein K491DRAFT_670618 [Lophiostoma macrostomum CBS 122681]|uniref:Rhodopsin domain-containing protein n=1 Tax=Lophiostoma macrostomum CBS 122681 TaxID=1314788 RepID=A0A6A6SLT6_9PLEO|nr:hypothetical protein K491DRAFT_670618 [Lophiostoma macrostomum CBS 122681]